MKVIGIDVGLNGAVVLLGNGKILEVFDMPTVAVKRGNGNGRDYLIPAIVEFINTHRAELVVIEGQHAMPKNGSLASFSLGRALGILEGIVAAVQIPYCKVHSATWKAKMLAGMAKGKGSSLIRACQLFPESAQYFSRKKDEGRAEATLIAQYGYKYLNGNQEKVALPDNQISTE